MQLPTFLNLLFHGLILAYVATILVLIYALYKIMKGDEDI